MLTLAGAILVSYERAVALLNFGAFLAFMGVNLSTMRRYYFDAPAGQRKLRSSFLMPGAGLLFCAAIWVFLPVPAEIAGRGWLLVGINCSIARTKATSAQARSVVDARARLVTYFLTSSSTCRK